MRYRPAKSLHTRYVFSVDEKLERDLLFTNNPVLISGLALAPVVGAATTLQNALILTVAALVIVTPVRFFGNLIGGRMPVPLRMIIYALISSLMYIPAYMLIRSVFSISLAGLGLYLPMITADSLVLSRAEIPEAEKIKDSVRNGVFTSLGFALAVLGIGAVRELLSAGRVYGITIPYMERLFPIFATPAGGFIMAAIMAAAMQWVAAMRKRAAYRGERETDE